MTTCSPLPARADVLIIGGGIIGCAAALFLARAGLAVVLCEKGRIGAEQSGRNWGWIRRIGRHGAELPLARRALQLWPRLQAEGLNMGYAQTGLAYLCKDESEQQARRAWLKTHGEAAGGDIRMLSAAQAKELLPAAQGRFAGALFAPRDGRAEPLMATRALATAARAQGAVIMENCAVRDIELQAGRVHGLMTEKGSVRGRKVILAGGIWSRLLCDRLRLRLPQLGVVNSVHYTAPLMGGPSIVAGGGEYAFRPTRDGGYAVAHWRISQTLLTAQHIRFARQFLPALASGWRDLPPRLASPAQPWAARAGWKAGKPTPFERARVLDPSPSRRILKAAMMALERDFPVFRQARIVGAQAGIIDVLPDVLPVISEVEDIPGLILATGFSGHGFGIGPAAGEAIARLAQGLKADVDLSAFSLSRFSSPGKGRAGHSRQRPLML